jgi:hypothetical protein
LNIILIWTSLFTMGVPALLKSDMGIIQFFFGIV